MRIVDNDYYAIYGKSWLNKVPVSFKLTAVTAVLTMAVLVQNYAVMGIIYAILLLTVLVSSVPSVKIISLSLYPLIFIVFYLISINNLTLEYAFLIIFKAISAAMGFVLLIFTTPYYEIFSKLDKFLPSFLVNILFITYRSIFILAAILENLQLAMYIRGKPSFSKPVYSIKRIANTLGYLIIRSMESSENMYEGMRIRGYSGNFRFLRK